MAELGEEDDPDKWMVDMEFFLSNGVPSEEMGKEQRKRIEVRGWAYCLYHGNLYNKSADEIWRRVVRSDEQKEILREVHCGITGGHYAGEATARKVWQSRLWWKTVIRDAHRHTKE